jgi:hypothetical protein
MITAELRSILISLLALLAGILGSGPAAATNVVSYTNGNWTNANIWIVGGVTNARAPDVGDDVIITNTVAMNESSQKNVGSLTINSGGILTHSANSTTEIYKIDLVVSNNLSINGTGAIDVSGKGYKFIVSIGSGPGGGKAVPGAGMGGGGGGYGGEGGGNDAAGLRGNAYGSMASPTNLGSSGGGDYGFAGGAGGGAIKLAVGGTLAVNGAIAADGAAGTGAGGGGAGGSIWIEAGSLTGSVAGSIRANGAVPVFSTSYGGGGGGGRIALYWATNSYLGTNSAKGWNESGGGTGGAGTLYSKAGTNGADIIIDNWISTGMFGSAGTWETNNNSLAGIRSLTIRRCGYLKHAATFSNGLNITGSTLVIETNGAINVNGKGYAYATGSGPGGGRPIQAAGGGGGGGGHGGQGGRQSSTYGLTNGYPTTPTNMGSSGGGEYGTTAGAGGGVVRLVVDTLVVNGEIAADGAAGTCYSGGNAGSGAGGSIWINAISLTGSGPIHANGGPPVAYSDTYGGGGGGGRIAVYVRNAPFYSTCYVVNGGTTASGAYPGQNGTIYCDFKPRGTMFSTW